MKFIYGRKLNLTSRIEYSQKAYKIIGLKCPVEELPESLHFATIDNLVFKIPYISDANTIVEYSLHKSISLASKILSYFELEEVDLNEQQQSPYQNGYPVESFDKRARGYLINDFDGSKKVDKASLTRLLTQYVKNMESILTGSNNTPAFISKIIKKKDINAYINYRANNSIDNMVRKVVDKYINREENVRGLPNSIRDLMLDVVDGYEFFMDAVEVNSKYLIYNEFISDVHDNIMTNILKSVIQITVKKEGISYLTIAANSIEESDTVTNDLIDLLNIQFSAGFKYTEENIDDFGDLTAKTQGNGYTARSLTDAGCNPLITTNYDLLFTSKPEYLSEEGKEARQEFLLFANNVIAPRIKIFDISKMKEEDSNAKFYVREFIQSLLYEYSQLSSNSYMNLNVLFKRTFPAIIKPVGTTIESLSAKYKDMINLEWSDELTRTVRFSTKDLEESIRHRYFFPSSIPSATRYLDARNMVVDTLLPQSMFLSKMDLEKTNRTFQSSQNLFTKTTYAISPLTAAAFGCKLIPIEHLCRTLGFTKEKIKEMMGIVQKRSINFVFVGTGGTGNNTAIWLAKMLDMCNLPFLFNKVFAFEKESAEIHNLLRFPKDPYQITVDSNIFANYNPVTSDKNKCNIIASELRALSKEMPTCYERYIANNDNTAAAYPTNVFQTISVTEPELDANGEVIDFKTITKHTPRPNTVFYGAPDITTRQNLSNVGNFISATHASNSCNIFINPEQDAMIQVESYGMIQLAPFFMNQLRMAIGLLEILSDADYLTLLSKKDHEFLSYQFDPESVTLKNDRVYNFKIINNPEMATENQANTAQLEF